MDFKIEPIDENGILDHDFYSSEEYSEKLSILKNYLELEGFKSLTEEFSIRLNKHSWRCKPIIPRKKKPLE